MLISKKYNLLTVHAPEMCCNKKNCLFKANDSTTRRREKASMKKLTHNKQQAWCANIASIFGLEGNLVCWYITHRIHVWLDLVGFMANVGKYSIHWVMVYLLHKEALDWQKKSTINESQQDSRSDFFQRASLICKFYKWRIWWEGQTFATI